MASMVLCSNVVGNNKTLINFYLFFSNQIYVLMIGEPNCVEQYKTMHAQK